MDAGASLLSSSEKTDHAKSRACSLSTDSNGSFIYPCEFDRKIFVEDQES